MNILKLNNKITCGCGTKFKYKNSDLYLSDQSYSDNILTVLRVYKSVDCPNCNTRHNVVKIKQL